MQTGVLFRMVVRSADWTLLGTSDARWDYQVKAEFAWLNLLRVVLIGA